MPEATQWSWPRRRAGPMAYVDAGEGKSMLLIHGVGLNANAWSPQIEAFCKTHRVIAIDMPGHGASERLEAGARLEAYVARIADLMTILAIERTAVIGHSMGGLIATGLALAHPDLCTHLGVLNAVYKREPESALPLLPAQGAWPWIRRRMMLKARSNAGSDQNMAASPFMFAAGC